MDDQQKSTNEGEIEKASTDPNEVILYTAEKSNDLQQMYIDFTALGGLLTDDDGNLTRMTIGEFANKIGVDRTTLYSWKRKMPDFWDRVEERRNKIGTQARVNKVWNGIYMKAATGNPEAAKLFLGQFAKWQPPSQKVEMEVGNGLADLLQHVRNAQQQEESRNKRLTIEADESTEANS